jgi:hypothetical protein
MVFPLEHFSLQLAYGRKAAEISTISLEQALIEFTQYWARINNASFLITNNLKWSFDPSTPYWQELCARIQNGEKADVIAYDLYRRNDQETNEGETIFGCFRFDFNSEFEGDAGVIKLHFHNRDVSGFGPLSRERQAKRIKDLKSMFSAIQENYPQAKVVHGGSWLYNIEAYTRLFPRSFTTHISVEEVPFPRTSGIWGQFINSEGAIKNEMVDAFLTKVNKAKTIDQLLQCFEFKILYPSGKIEDFYDFYAVR